MAGGQEAGTDPVGYWSKAQIEAGGLNLLFANIVGRRDETSGNGFAKFLGGEDAGGDESFSRDQSGIPQCLGFITYR